MARQAPRLVGGYENTKGPVPSKTIKGCLFDDVTTKSLFRIFVVVSENGIHKKKKHFHWSNKHIKQIYKYKLTLQISPLNTLFHQNNLSSNPMFTIFLE